MSDDPLGPAPHNMWTRDQWMPVLMEILKPKHQVRRFDINMPDDTPVPLDGLLDAAHHVIHQGHGLTEGLTVWYGHVSEVELRRSKDWATAIGLELHLQYVTVVLRADHTIQHVLDVHWDMRTQWGNQWGQISISKYVTADGQYEYDMTEDPFGINEIEMGQSATLPTEKTLENSQVDKQDFDWQQYHSQDAQGQQSEMQFEAVQQEQEQL